MRQARARARSRSRAGCDAGRGRASPPRSRRARRRAGRRRDRPRSGARHRQRVDRGRRADLRGPRPLEAGHDRHRAAARDVVGGVGRRPRVDVPPARPTSRSTTARRSTPTRSCSRSSACSIRSTRITSRRRRDYWRTLFKDVDRGRRGRSRCTVAIHDRAAVRAVARRPRDVSDACRRRRCGAGATRSRSHPVGTGPFAFEEWTRGERVIARAAPRLLGRRRRARAHRVPGRDRRAPAPGRARVRLGRSRGRDPPRRAAVRRAAPRARAAPHRRQQRQLPRDQHAAPAVRRRARAARGELRDQQEADRQARATRAARSPPTARCRRRSGAITCRSTPYGYDPAAAQAAARRGDRRRHASIPSKVYTLYAPSTPRPYVPQPERVARFIQAALDEVGITTELVLQQYSQHTRAPSKRASTTSRCSAGSATPATPTTSSTCCSTPTTRSPVSAQNVAFYRDAERRRAARARRRSSDAQARAASCTRGAGSDRAPRRRGCRSRTPSSWSPRAPSLEHVVLSPTGHPVYSLIRRRP